MHAASAGQEEMVIILVNHGAKVDQAGTDGNTALILASKRGHLGALHALLAQGANFHLQNSDGETALTQAKTEEIKQLLIAAGARE